MVDWTKGLRFKKAQPGDTPNVPRVPTVVGSFIDSGGATRYVVVTRPWTSDGIYGLAVYDDGGQPLPAYKDSFRSSGILDAEIINGPEIKRVRQRISNGPFVNVTYEGDKPIHVELAP